MEHPKHREGPPAWQRRYILITDVALSAAAITAVVLPNLGVQTIVIDPPPIPPVAQAFEL